METIKIERCTVCESSIIDDTENGERICSGCGIVMQEHMEDCLLYTSDAADE